MTPIPLIPPPLPPVKPPLPRCERDNITIFKRYPGPHAAYYHKFEYQGRQHMLKLAATAEDSFPIAKKLRAAILDRRFDVLAATKQRRPTSTLGEIFARYESAAPAFSSIYLSTAQANIQACRKILRLCGRAQAPDEQINALPSSDLTAAAFETYKTAMLKAAGPDKLKQDRAFVTANSTIRMARSLFTKKILRKKFYGQLVLPEVASLAAVELFKETSKGYKMPSAEAVARIRAAAPALKAADPNAYKIYLLALGIGLRKSEIKTARKHWFQSRLERGGDGSPPQETITLVVQTETDFRPKGKQERTLPVDRALYEELCELIIPVIGGDDYLLHGKPSERCDKSFRRFSAWMKSLGWDRLKKAHELRKMFGSYVTHQAGLRAAQRTLGHAQITTTEDYYAGDIELPKYSIPR